MLSWSAGITLVSHSCLLHHIVADGTGTHACCSGTRDAASTLGPPAHFPAITPQEARSVLHTQNLWLQLASIPQPALTSSYVNPAGPLAAQNTEAGKTKKGIAAAEGAGGTPGRAAPGSSTRSPAFMSPTGSSRRTPLRTPARKGFFVTELTLLRAS